jgi:hypothetical protein
MSKVLVTQKYDSAMRKIRLLKALIISLLGSPEIAHSYSEFQKSKHWGLWPDRNLNPLTRNPKRYFSQSDEDGILEKILLRLDISSKGKFLEFGVGDGSQNNSLALITKGWESYWIGGEDLKFIFPNSPKHHFKKTWITIENLGEITNEALAKLNTRGDTVDIVSLDLDGNDWHLVKYLLENGLHPSVWICEYNGKFPPGAEWVMPYDGNHVWDGFEYFGASFTSYVKLLGIHGYFPVACSIQGANIFFVKEKYRSKFSDIEMQVNDLYQTQFYYGVSDRTLESIFNLRREE